jgi:phosphoribosylglycinamide formyltransferase-1
MKRAGPKVAVLASGHGTNLQALIDAVEDGAIEGNIVLVASDRPHAVALERARRTGIPAAHVRVAPTRMPGYDDALIEKLGNTAPDLIVLAGYMRIVSPAFVAAFGDRCLNLHPSLLPKHKGFDTHRRALEAGDRHHGATVHFVTAELDAGPRVIQYRLEIGPDDTEDSLSARVHVGEYIILPRAVGWYCAGRLRLVDGAVMLDGTPLAEPVVVEETP